jgi:hypothetical protein
MNNVRQLFALNAERRETLKQFYADQARFFMHQIANPAGGAAALSIAVTGESQVVTKLASVDAAHAAVLLVELDSIRAKLVQFITDQAPELLEKVNQSEHGQASKSNVVPLRSTVLTQRL